MELPDSKNKEDDLGDVGVLCKSIKKLICEGNEEQLEHFLQQANIRNILVENVWEVLPDLCALVHDKMESENPHLLARIEQALFFLVENASAKEMVVLIAEQLKEQNDSLFRLLLRLLSKCLLRITAKKGHSLALVLKSFYGYIARIPLPKDQILEGKELLLLDLDENVQRITTVVPSFLEFLSPFMLEQSWNVDECQKQNRSEKQVKDLTCCLVQLLGRPLAFLDLSHNLTLLSNPSAKSNSRACAETVVNLLSRLHQDFVKVISDIYEEYKRAETRMSKKVVSDAIDPDEESVLPLLGIGTLVYLLFSENLAVNSIPCVYTRYFLFEFSMPFVICLIQRTELLLVMKGLSLLGSVLRYLIPKSWSANFLECPSVLELIRSVVYVASTIKSNELGELALRTLLTLLKMFEVGGRIRLFQYLLKTSPRGKVTGYVITMLTNEMSEAFRNDPSEFFTLATEKLLMLIFALPKGEKTDLLDHSDRIMGALNLLRFLLLQDAADQDISGIWRIMPLIEQKYFQVLGNGISLSRAHYQLEQRKMRERKTNNATTRENSAADQVSLTKQQQLQAVQMAINTFDMMEGVLGKVSDLVQRRKKETFRDESEHIKV